ncbi:MAG: helix-turn-helix domain-containing protein [Candidatus Saganbacteria bacterium]|nr:helix-turn-helix domain-containing protein [Candidatus Saganbacteria bacterium]
MEIKEHEVYTLEETTSLLKISRSTFLRLIKKGILNAYKVGGQYRVLGREILNLFNPKVRDGAKSAYHKVIDRVKERLELIK